MSSTTGHPSYDHWINPSLPDIVRFARQQELRAMEAEGQDLATLHQPLESLSQVPKQPTPHTFTPSIALPDLVRFARERENRQETFQADYYLTPWDGLRQDTHMSYLYHHAEPLMPLRGRDLAVMATFFQDNDLQNGSL